MNVLSLDPGTANCAWVLLIDGLPKKWGGWLKDNSWSQIPVDVRCHRISRAVSGLLSLYDVDVLISERYFHGSKQSGKTIYDRGRLDLWVDLAAGHIPRYYIHPIHLKQWVTGNHKAGKEEMADAIMQHPAISSRGLHESESFLDTIHAALKPAQREHVLEAFALGWVGTVCEWVRLGYTVELTRQQRELVGRIFKNGNPSLPMFDQAVGIPPVKEPE